MNKAQIIAEDRMYISYNLTAVKQLFIDIYSTKWLEKYSSVAAWILYLHVMQFYLVLKWKTPYLTKGNVC